MNASAWGRRRAERRKTARRARDRRVLGWDMVRWIGWVGWVRLGWVVEEEEEEKGRGKG